ncbi:MAG TPA: hypothetical protein VFB52_04950, partial [Solirubrobacterales bacterium]|nr:hypothetical protein [Solirubrobacterales bacterium]
MEADLQLASGALHEAGTIETFLGLDGCSVKVPDPLKTLASAFAVLVCFLALPGFASADEFFINTLEDETNGPFACAEISGDCSLRDAIERGNESTTEDDVVNFEAVLGGPIALGSQLPPITDTLLI